MTPTERDSLVDAARALGPMWGVPLLGAIFSGLVLASVYGWRRKE